MANYANPEVLVSTDWVKDNLDKPGIKLVEIDVDPWVRLFEQRDDRLHRDVVEVPDGELLRGGSSSGRCRASIWPRWRTCVGG